MRHYSHLNTARLVISNYTGDRPFGYFIKEFFRAEKKYGSKDRKRIAHLCYSYFRLGNAGRDLSIDDRILLGLFLTSTTPDELLQEMKPEWNSIIDRPITEKIKKAGDRFSVSDIFPGTEYISSQIDRESFILSHLQQPDLFLRIRPGHQQVVLNKLQQHGILFRQIGESALALPNASRLEEIFEINREIVVQDMNSQRVGELMQIPMNDPANGDSRLKVWDCCAASGGKSIMAFDINPKVDLTVSDIRENILINLRKRFTEARIQGYKTYVVDVANNPININKAFDETTFDLVIADVPCSGSGTWGRTPEQLSFFKPEQIAEYASRQQKILTNVIPRIKPGGYLLYITCSVYRQENEDMIAFIRERFEMKNIQMNLLKGYEMRADTLFAALLQKPL